eukprot:4003018-Alexandrium_andersonii.AAC.1
MERPAIAETPRKEAPLFHTGPSEPQGPLGPICGQAPYCCMGEHASTWQHWALRNALSGRSRP